MQVVVVGAQSQPLGPAALVAAELVQVAFHLHSVEALLVVVAVVVVTTRLVVVQQEEVEVEVAVDTTPEACVKKQYLGGTHRL